MLGRVHGPYSVSENNKRIEIILINEDGSMKSRSSMPYYRYLEEVKQGLHQYEQYSLLTNYEKRVRYYNKVKEEYNLPLITEDNKEQFYYPNAFEIKERPGYYYIPFEGSVYAINKNGDIIIIDNKEQINYNFKNGYVISKIRLLINKNNFVKRTTVSKHRLLALLFMPRPDRHIDKPYANLEVNHKDGIKDNNDLDNLEWVTSIENLDHAVINGLNKFIPESKPVLAKNIITGEIKYYYSVSSCSKDFDIHQGLLNKHLNSSNYGLVCINNYIFKYDNNAPWPNRYPIVKNNKGYFKSTPDIIVKNIITGETTIYKSLKYATKQLNISRTNLRRHFDKYGKNQPYKEYIFYTLEEFKKEILQ